MQWSNRRAHAKLEHDVTAHQTVDLLERRIAIIKQGRNGCDRGGNIGSVQLARSAVQGKRLRQIGWKLPAGRHDSGERHETGCAVQCPGQIVRE